MAEQSRLSVYYCRAENDVENGGASITNPPVKRQFDVLILGGGAAGLLCAIEAGKRGRRVAILEHADRIGKKILISGGGRCNFTNLYCQPENFLSANPHFAKSALARYTPSDFIALVEKHRIPYHEKKLGQLFCDGSARAIVSMLEEECRAAHAEILVGVSAREPRRADEFVVTTDREEVSRRGTRRLHRRIVSCEDGCHPFRL